MADSILMYAITTAVFVAFAIILGTSRAKRIRRTPAPIPTPEKTS